MSKFNLEFYGDLIIVQVKLFDANDNFVDLKLALDTGSTKTLVTPTALQSLGYQVLNRKNDIVVTTGSRNEKAFSVKKFRIHG